MNHQTDTPKGFIAVPGHTHLFRREGGTYYFRIKVPKPIRSAIQTTEIRRTLDTKTPKIAYQRVCKVAAEWLARFRLEEAKLKRKNSPPDESTALTREEIDWIVADFFVRAESDAERWTARLLDDPDADIDGTIFDLERDAEALEVRRGVDPHQVNIGEGYLIKYLKAHGSDWKIIPESDNWNELVREIRKAAAENKKRSIDRLDQVAPQRRDFEEYTSRTILPPPPRRRITLDEYLKEYMEYLVATKANTTPAAYKIPLRILQESIEGTTPLHLVTREAVEKACKVLLKVPVNMAQRYPGLAAEDAIAEARRKGDERKIKPRTLSNYYLLIVAFFNHAKDAEYIDRNPAKSKSLAALFPRDERRSEKAFTDKELRSIFTAPLYTGCVDDNRNYNRVGAEVPRHGRFWVPLLALFHGFRSNEVCQLYTEDVKEESGIMYFHIRDSLDDESSTEKHLKNSASSRLVPVHPEILRMGFAEYVAERRSQNKSPRLFPTLPLSKNTLRYSHNFSKWFGEFLVSACGHKPKATFHSFRKHFATNLSNAGVAEVLIERLAGWRGHGMLRTVYHLSELPSLHAAISKLSYPALDLSHLYIDQSPPNP